MGQYLFFLDLEELNLLHAETKRFGQRLDERSGNMNSASSISLSELTSHPRVTKTDARQLNHRVSAKEKCANMKEAG